MDKTYIDWIQSLKQKIQSAQIKASIAVNDALITHSTPVRIRFPR